MYSFYRSLISTVFLRNFDDTVGIIDKRKMNGFNNVSLVDTIKQVLTCLHTGTILILWLLKRLVFLGGFYVG